MSFYTLIDKNEQIESLEHKELKPAFKFFFALFFKSKNYSREYLLNKGICILYCNNDVIQCGNAQGVNDKWGWEKLEYTDFVNRIKS